MAAPTINQEDLEWHLDELIYYARVGDFDEVDCQLGNARRRCNVHPFYIIMASKNAETANTLLHMASANGHSEIVAWLLRFDPDIPVTLGLRPTGRGVPSGGKRSPLLDMTNNSGSTALHYAAMNGQLPTIEVLVNAGADVQTKNDAGYTPADEAEAAQKPRCASWLQECKELGHAPEVEEPLEPEGPPLTNGVEASDSSSSS